MVERPQPGGLVLSIGRLYCDLVFRGLAAMPRLGEERFAEEVAVVPGGGGFITAAHLIGLGRPSGLLARLGEDPISQALRPALEGSGIDLAFLESAADAGPQLTVAMVQDGERAFLSRRAGPARPATLAAALGDARACHLHIAEFATLAEIPDLVSEARRRGLTVSLDPSWDDALIRSHDLIARCSGVDIFLPNAAEACVIAGCDDLDLAGRRLAEHFAVVAIKDGGAGARLYCGGDQITLPAAPCRKVIDTTGAGDAFNAGFLAAWLAGHTPERTLAEGIACGTLSVQSVGGTGSKLDPRQVAHLADQLLETPVRRHG
ncbi:carbohydrate kinase family protein [Bosea sp. F3-2]|uniref:carbohydrate kinase family protein n=1 Tax=Bosea sp. F3-2 TaxID=2599640 RepID=UPI0011EF3EDA|nr:carbohydrate kinase family protein [Bosea sp. F3-2]QEL22291.1 carbohydrate kinase family protein [Bosea sp. F3-2]